MKYLFVLLFLLFHCNDSPKKPPIDSTKLYLPAEVEINQILRSKDDYKLINEKAVEAGFNNAREWHKFEVTKIDPDELQAYYNKYKPSFVQAVGTDAISTERRRIADRIAWYKIIMKVKGEIDAMPEIFAEVDYQKISSEGDPSLGEKNLPVIVYEFSDYQCTYCSRSQEINFALREKFAGKMRWVFKDFPLQDIHDDAFQAHIAANCVLRFEKDKFWTYHQVLFENYKHLEKQELFQYAEEAGVDTDKLKKCLNDKSLVASITTEIKNDIAEGKKLGLTGTPTFIVNGKVIIGYRGYTFFQKFIADEIKKM